MKLLLSFFSFLAALLIGIKPCTSTEVSEPPGAEILSGTADQAIGSEVPRERLAENFSDAEVFRLRAFSEPLVADRRVASEEERAAFLRAINDYLSDKGSESLEAFLRQWPESRWAAALEHNLGLLKFREGFFTAAIGYWQDAWERARDSEDPRLRALANQSVAELAGMQARLGRIEVLRPLLRILKEREVGGSARQMLSTSAEALNEMEVRPEKCFKCGPFALAEVRKSLGIANAYSPEILEIKSPYRGFSLTEVSALATKLGMPSQMARWSDSAAEIPVPSVVNWKLGHYAAIIGQEAGKYRLKDLTFGFDNLVSAEAIRAETSGYFLLPTATLPRGFETVPAAEGWKVFGRGYTSRDMANQVTKGDHQVPEDPCTPGMAAYSVHTMMVSLHVEDTPLGYEPPFGPARQFARQLQRAGDLAARQLELHQLRAPMDAQLEWLHPDQYRGRRHSRLARRRQRRASPSSLGSAISVTSIPSRRQSL